MFNIRTDLALEAKEIYEIVKEANLAAEEII